MTDGWVKSILVFLGAGLGANGRYWFGAWVRDRLTGPFPWGTFLINVTGSLLIGIAMGLIVRRPSTEDWRVFLVVGVLGGYTTFSSFSYENVRLLQDGRYLLALGNAGGSCGLGLLATWLGLALASAVR